MQRPLLSLALASALALAFAPTACSSSSTTTPPTGATFTQVYTEIIGPTCAPVCHNTEAKSAKYENHLDMSTQAAAFKNLVGVQAAGIACSGKATRVVAGDASSSLLYEKVSESKPPCGAQMPLKCGTTGAPACLTTAQQTLIQDWINAGAMND